MAIDPAIDDAQITSLLPRCQRGDTAAVEALYDLYADRLYRYLLARVGNADAAADLTTEIFVRVLKNIGGFRLNSRRPAASFSAWLYRIAANLVADHHRQRRRTAETDLSEDLRIATREPTPHRLVEQQEILAGLSQAMEALSEDQRLVILGKFGEDMSNAEVARWLGKTEGAVKSLQHRALQALGRLLGAEEQPSWS